MPPRASSSGEAANQTVLDGAALVGKLRRAHAGRGSCTGSASASGGNDAVDEAASGSVGYAFGWFPAGRGVDEATRAFHAGLDRDASSPAARTFRVNLTTRGTRFPIPARFDLEHVCVSGRGGGLYAINPLVVGSSSTTSAQQPPVDPIAIRLDGLEDERRAPVRGEVYIRDAHDVDRDVGAPTRRVFRNASEPLIIHPLLSQSDNLGHVMFRVMALRRTLREAAKQRGPQQPVLLYYVTGAGAASVTPRHMYGAFAGLINSTRILAAVSPGSLVPLRRPAEDATAAAGGPEADGNVAPRPYRFQRRIQQRVEDERLRGAPDVCFERAVVAWAPVHMYSGKYAHQRLYQQRVTLPELRRLRDDMTACWGLPTTRVASVPGGLSDAAPASNVATAATARWITLIERRETRRLLNMKALATAYTAELKDQGWDSSFGVRVVDFAELPPAQQARVSRESMALVGMHGTALQWALAMPEGAVVLEIQYPGYACTPPGINHPDRRLCEYGPAAIAASVSHVTFRVNGEGRNGSAVSCASSDREQRRNCDTQLGDSERDAIVNATFCSLRHGFKNAADRCAPSTSA